MKKLRVGVIGVGHLGKAHIANFKEIKLAELVGVFDIDSEKTKKNAYDYKIKPFDSFKSMLKEIDAVSIVVPTSFHYEIAIGALNEGKHIFIEKPITATLSEAEKLIELGNKKGLKIQVGHIERFNPAFVSLNNFKLQPHFIESHRLALFNPRGMDVSVVLDLMIHDIDIVLSLIKSPIMRIDANGVNVISDSIDIANARIQFENGAVANITGSRISQKNMRKMRIFQKSNYITVDFLKKDTEIYSIFDENEEIPENNAILIQEPEFQGKKKKIFLQKPRISDENALKMELESFTESVLYDKDVIVGAYEGKKALETALQIMDKINKGNFK
jgi:predicted dehydrogenase